MKKIMVFALLGLMAAATMASCSKDETENKDKTENKPSVLDTLEVDTTPITATVLAGTYSIAVTSNTTWTVAADAAATWCIPSPAQSTGNGTITVTLTINTNKAETRAATLTVSAGSLSKQVNVTQVTVDKPINAASDELWVLENPDHSYQIWSAPITVPACSGTAFSTLGCRNAGTYTGTGYLYNWAYVNENKSTTLCPEPWRVPSSADFMFLDGALQAKAEAGKSSADLYTGSRWGAVYSGGYVVVSIMGQNQYAYYWSSTEDSNTTASYLVIDATKGTAEQVSKAKSSGYQVRCVIR